MSLQLVKTYPIDTKCRINIEPVSEDLILLAIEMQGDRLCFDSRPYHWQYDFGDFPPLDISLDSETGLLKEITIFIRKKKLEQHQSYAHECLTQRVGYPAFNISDRINNAYYYDESVDITIARVHSNVVVSLNDQTVYTKLKVNHTLDILLTAQNNFAGFVIHGLDQSSE